MHMFLLGYCALNESPYVMDLAAEKSGQATIRFGLERLMSAVNTPAVHELIRMAYSSKDNYLK